MATKRIKLLKPWTLYAAGAEVEFQTSVADLLIQRGRAEEVEATTVKPGEDLVADENLHYAVKYGALTKKNNKQCRPLKTKKK